MKKLTKLMPGAGILLLVMLFCQNCTNKPSTDKLSTWSHYGGAPDQSKYFDNPQITKENVSQLEVAWVYPTHDNSRYLGQPIIADSILYVMGKNYSLIAVNLLNMEEIWIHANLNGISRRGINYWESDDKKDRRLLFTLNNSLQAIDATTGTIIESFGTNGYVDLREGLDRDPTSIRRIQSMMPGVVYEDLVIIGSAPGENYFSPPGHVRAYNVVTGKKEWTFRTIPHPGEYGYDTWPKDAYKYVGGTNVWSEMSVDEERGIVFLPVGSPTYDFYGADRLGSNLFGNSLVALDARTGKRIWHYQTVHHDIWDYDLSAAPQLLTVNHQDKKIDAVAIATKSGFVFLFDRETGEPLFPIEEKPFPPSNMPGEEAWPTQPISSLPSFTRHEVTKETLNPYFPDSVREQWYRRIDAAKSGLYIPLSDQHETMTMPGALAGANYGNTGSDPANGMMYIMAQEYGSVYQLEKVVPRQAGLSNDQVASIKTFLTTNCQSCHGVDMKGAAGPSLVKAGEYIFYPEFKEVIENGKGIMPGFVHVDEQTVRNIYLYLGGDPRFFNFRNARDEQMPEGPVVASGGASIEPDKNRLPPMLDYPEDTEHPPVRFRTDYGTEEEAILGPPWSYMVAYDLNRGTIKWKQAIGEDSLYVQGDKTKGAPAGVLRKGMIVTSTGLVFATAKGGKVYAMEADTGKVLWESTLSHETNGQPCMYTLNGKQYLLVNASAPFAQGSYNHSRKAGALPKGYVAFALPSGVADN